jgi:cytochrome c-type biogenesis protein CcmH/NrfG
MNAFLSLAILAGILLLLVLVALGFIFRKDYRHFCLTLIFCLASLGLGFYLNPDISHAYHFQLEQQALGKAKAILGDEEKLKRLLSVLKKQLIQHPNDDKARVLLARIYAGQDRWPEAFQALEPAYLHQKNDLKLSLFYVETRWHLKGRLDKRGRDILYQLLRLNPNQIESLMMLASDAKSRGCYQEALPYLQRLSILFAGDEKIKAEIDSAIFEAKNKSKSACMAPF